MKYSEIKFVAQQYKNKQWTVWISRDNQKFMIGSGIGNVDELVKLVKDIPLERTYYQPKPDAEKEKMKEEIKRLQQTIDELVMNRDAQLNAIKETIESLNKNNSVLKSNSHSKRLYGLQPSSLFFD